MSRILLVDDDPQSLESTRRILSFSGHDVLTARDGQEALDLVRPMVEGKPSEKLDLVVTDVRMPRLGGIEFLRALKICREDLPVVLMTAFGRVDEAVWAMKLGAVDFLMKPFKRQALLQAVEAALLRAQPAKEEDDSVSVKSAENQKSNSEAPSDSDPLIGSSAVMKHLKETIAQVAQTNATILLAGESGTGKELVAKCIHQKSRVAEGPFLALNCAAIPENLLESELFGYEKGAFSGAQTSKAGLFEAAHGGTLLLDEIGDMPTHLQAKLLRVLQEGEVLRLGSTQPRKINVRMISATHQNLHEKVKKGEFREDLLYRLEVVAIAVPALRERKEDIPRLAWHFFEHARRRHHKEDLKGLSEETLIRLKRHTWPGNVRELSNAIERAVVFAKGEEIQVEDLPVHLLALTKDPHSPALTSEMLNKDGVSEQKNSLQIPVGTALRDVEEMLIKKTLEATAGDKTMAARLLGVNSRTIYRKLEKDQKGPLEIEKPEKTKEPENGA